MVEVQDPLGRLMLKWSYESPNARWRGPLWAVFCLLVCVFFVCASIAIKYGSIWMIIAFSSLFLYIAVGVHLLMLTRHAEFALFQDGLRVKRYWNTGDAGRSQMYWWEEFAAFSVRDAVAKLHRKGEAPVILYCGPNIERVDDILTRKIRKQLPEW